MRKMRMLLVLGVWLMVLPYLGFPYSWKDTLTTLSGLALIFMSYLLYKEFKAKETNEAVFDNFSENSDFNENDGEITKSEEHLI